MFFISDFFVRNEIKVYDIFFFTRVSALNGKFK